MLARVSQCLLALQHHGSPDAAAHACGLSLQEFHGLLHHAQRTYGRPVARVVDEFGPPQLELILRAALRAPDHGGLHPWRIIEFRSEARGALAAIFEEEKRRRDPLASPTDLQQAREHATRAPVLLGFVVSPEHNSSVPLREQWLAAGAALCNLLNAAHQLGFGAVMLSGERCHDAVLLSQLGVLSDEFLAGFVSIGRVVQAPPQRRLVPPGGVWSCWTPETKT
jgi:nitroreductase